MKVESMVLGQIQTNCYFSINEATKETIVIDPADQAGGHHSEGCGRGAAI